MFHRWGAFIFRNRRVVALFMLVLAIGALPFAGRTSEALSAGGWLDPHSESAQVASRLAAEFNGGRSSLVAIVGRQAPGADATSPEFQAALATTLSAIRADPSVAGIVGFAETGDRRFISTDGSLAYVVVNLTVSDEGSLAIYPDLRARIVPPAGYTALVSGYAALEIDTSTQADADLQRAETISLPIVALVLLLVFASLVAAAMPLLVAGLAIPTSLGIVYFIARLTEMSVFVLNIASMLGLALAIDYSLFIVSRFREELRRGYPVEEALPRTIATSGKAVLFSGVAVAIGLSGLMIFPFSTIRSIGLGSALVVACSVLFALTFLPAVLGMLGPRVNALSLDGLRRRLGRPATPEHDLALAAHDPAHPSRWARVARGVMAHPWRVLVPVVAVLIAAGTPFFHMQQGVPGAEVLPPGLESRDTFAVLSRAFAPGDTSPMIVLADLAGSPTDPTTIAALEAYAGRLAAIPGVSRVDSYFTLRHPATGQPLPDGRVATLFGLPAAQRPPGLNGLLDQYVAGRTVRLDVISPYVASRPEATDLVPTIRGVDPGPAVSRVSVGGEAALGADFLRGQAERLPLAVGWTMLATAAILFLLFGSVLLPFKAVLMTLLSAAASFGALVFVFQDGNFQGPLRFESPGFTVAGIPIIMFCVIFGLSMDYEVLLLSRIQEAWRRTSDNAASVAEGLVRTARVITGAALVMVCVFSAFVLADQVTIKSVGVGMAIAVAVDASIVRVLLVPATMRLLGRWNWWAPGPLGRFAERVGFSHVEDADED